MKYFITYNRFAAISLTQFQFQLKKAKLEEFIFTRMLAEVLLLWSAAASVNLVSDSEYSWREIIQSLHPILPATRLKAPTDTSLAWALVKVSLSAGLAIVVGG